MVLEIKGWHGQVSGEMSKKLDAACEINRPGYIWIYFGDLESFRKMWHEKFLFYPCEKNLENPFDGTIFVTQYSTWGMR